MSKTVTFGEVVEAVKRLTGFLPTRYGYSIFFGLVEVDRCLTDGKLVTNRNGSLRGHLGHRMAQPVYLKWYEVIFVFFGAIR